MTEARKLLRLIGEEAFGSPDARTLAAIDGIDDLGRLEDLLKGSQVPRSWLPNLMEGLSRHRECAQEETILAPRRKEKASPKRSLTSNRYGSDHRPHL